MSYREDASLNQNPYSEYLRKGKDPISKFEQYKRTPENKLAKGLSEEERYKYAKEENPFIYALAEQTTKFPWLENAINKSGEAVRPINERAEELSNDLYIKDALKGIVNTGAHIAGPVSENISKLTGINTRVEPFGQEYGSGNPYGELVSDISQLGSSAVAGKGLFNFLNMMSPKKSGYEGALGDILKGYVSGDTTAGPVGGVAGAILGATRRFGAGNQSKQIAADRAAVKGEYRGFFQELGDGARMAGANEIPPTGITSKQVTALKGGATEKKLDPITNYIDGNRSFDSAFKAQSELGKIIRELKHKSDKRSLFGYEEKALEAARDMQQSIKGSIRNTLGESKIPELRERFDDLLSGYERDVVGYDNPAIKKYLKHQGQSERSVHGTSRTAEKELVNSLKKNADFQSRFGKRYPELQHGWLAPAGLAGAGLGATGTALHKHVLKPIMDVIGGMS